MIQTVYGRSLLWMVATAAMALPAHARSTKATKANTEVTKYQHGDHEITKITTYHVRNLKQSASKVTPTQNKSSILEELGEGAGRSNEITFQKPASQKPATREFSNEPNRDLSRAFAKWRKGKQYDPQKIAEAKRELGDPAIEKVFGAELGELTNPEYGEIRRFVAERILEHPQHDSAKIAVSAAKGARELLHNPQSAEPQEKQEKQDKQKTIVDNRTEPNPQTKEVASKGYENLSPEEIREAIQENENERERKMELLGNEFQKRAKEIQARGLGLAKDDAALEKWVQDESAAIEKDFSDIDKALVAALPADLQYAELERKQNIEAAEKKLGEEYFAGFPKPGMTEKEQLETVENFLKARRTAVDAINKTYKPKLDSVYAGAESAEPTQTVSAKDLKPVTREEFNAKVNGVMRELGTVPNEDRMGIVTRAAKRFYQLGREPTRQEVDEIFDDEVARYRNGESKGSSVVPETAGETLADTGMIARDHAAKILEEAFSEAGFINDKLERSVSLLLKANAKETDPGRQAAISNEIAEAYESAAEEINAVKDAALKRIQTEVDVAEATGDEKSNTPEQAKALKEEFQQAADKLEQIEKEGGTEEALQEALDEHERRMAEILGGKNVVDESAAAENEKQDLPGKFDEATNEYKDELDKAKGDPGRVKAAQEKYQKAVEDLQALQDEQDRKQNEGEKESDKATHEYEKDIDEAKGDPDKIRAAQDKYQKAVEDLQALKDENDKKHKKDDNLNRDDNTANQDEHHDPHGLTEEQRKEHLDKIAQLDKAVEAIKNLNPGGFKAIEEAEHANEALGGEFTAKINEKKKEAAEYAIGGAKRLKKGKPEHNNLSAETALKLLEGAAKADPDRRSDVGKAIHTIFKTVAHKSNDYGTAKDLLALYKNVTGKDHFSRWTWTGLAQDRWMRGAVITLMKKVEKELKDSGKGGVSNRAALIASVNSALEATKEDARGDGWLGRRRKKLQKFIDSINTVEQRSAGLSDDAETKKLIAQELDEQQRQTKGGDETKQNKWNAAQRKALGLNNN